ncbi:MULTISPECIES: hypothetical protein [unclassified Paenibacillus]|uniref:hypothetical protein n=1 Tax=unclassified Paenibacillus TaxID=185978 RepID=UPI00089D2EF1|nr:MULTISPECIES: hypothetical protein [unclassified Paenibacillus]SEB27586.1 hypothetical protein SAMN03159332_6251 [Paenibacillus sp. 276b]SLK16353.1 hypothetical protein SAMN06272722_110142 [Paenibacillus sp. RU5A]SOC74340.1 hypothetical protein SAMN05880581_110142 [Paenibacillus sp. RU26A]SOC76465.1 hypothetical protein SAMN05880586_110142 [Paenibacillus sp. RU5M]
MYKKVIILTVITILMFVFAVPAFAESGLSIPSTNTKKELDISTVDGGRFSSAMDSLTGDTQTVGGKLAYPLFFFCLIFGILLCVGGIFSKKLLAAGGLSLVLGFAILLVLGDLGKAVDYMDYVAVTIRNYF